MGLPEAAQITWINVVTGRYKLYGRGIDRFVALALKLPGTRDKTVQDVPQNADCIKIGIHYQYGVSTFFSMSNIKNII